MKALLIIDLQNDFLAGGALAVPDGDAVVSVINRIQGQFDLVVATQDWHPSGHKSFASAHPGREVFQNIDLDGLDQTLWPDHCIQGTPGAELSGMLDQRNIEAIFRKGTDAEIDSYSAFYDNGHRKSTGLSSYLKGKGVDQVYVAGLAADYCVYYSVKDALSEGFSTFLIDNATRAISENVYLSVKEDVACRNGAVVIL